MSLEEKEKEFDLSTLSLFLKKHWKIILLLLILFFAFYLRFYHADYPVVGYHNWKETHYLTESRNFAEEGFFKYGFFVPSFDYLALDGNQDGAHSDSFPTISIVIGFFFSIFGADLMLARIITILFSVGSVLFLYLFMKEITGRNDLAFVSAFILALNPLHVFFGRNVQLINVALFFMLACFYVYVKWVKTNKSKFMILTAIFFSLCILTKYSFFLLLFPMLFIFPYKRLKYIKRNLKNYLISFVILLSIPVWFFYSNFYLPSKLGGSGAVAGRIFDFSVFFSSKLWEFFRQFIPDNYSWIGFVFALLGFALVLLLKRKTRFGKFIIGYVIGLIPWFLFMGDKIGGHSYHHYPLLPLFAALVGFAFFALAGLVVKFVRNFGVKGNAPKVINYLVIIFLIFLLWAPSMEAKDRQFNTQFIGLDIAGEYIDQHAGPDDKIFHSTHQSHGVLWHANRLGYNYPNSIEKLEKGEGLGARWLFIYQWGFDILDNVELWERIKSTYSIKQVVFTISNDQFAPVYFLLEKGGSFNETELNNLLKDRPINTRNYEYTTGQIQLSYVGL